MSPALRLLAPAKINFTLEVLGKRSDGYHKVRLLMAGVSLYDELSFKPWKSLNLSCDRPDLDLGPNNLIIKAARAMQGVAGSELGARIHLKKRIPLGGGLAGGSTDAAATLSGLNILWGLRLKVPKLLKIAAALGSDVPFCLKSGWAIGSGRGEKLKPLHLGRKLWLVLANPGFEVSTKWAYDNVVAASVSRQNHSQRAFAAIQTRDLKQLELSAINHLEPVTAGKYDEIDQYKELMRHSGALLTRMSGSGPTVLGLFENEAKAISAFKTIKKLAKTTVLVHTLDKIPKP